MTRALQITLVVCSAFVVAVLLVGMCVPHAVAATYYWNKTAMSGGSLTVGFCSGGTRTMKSIESTTADVCKFQWKYGYHVKAWVGETGTVLFNGWNCGSTKWQSFNSRTDSSRQVIVRVTGTGTCA